MKVALLLLVAAAIVSAHPKWNELEGYTFAQYVEDFGRSYQKGSDEYAFRENIFNEKLASIRKHNADKSMTWKRGVNLFTDMSAQEWKRFNGFKKSEYRMPSKEWKAPSRDGVPLPAEVDYRKWTAPRVLTAIKHQGSCGNCWAQSAAESMEAYYALATNMLPVLSSQQITSCVPAPYSYGCDGGDYGAGWRMINESKHGLTEEWAYPFTNFFFGPNSTTAKCKVLSNEYPRKPYSWFAELNEAGVTGMGHPTPNSAFDTMSALASLGPLSISVAAGNWQDYETGVMSNTNATGQSNEWQIDHAVQMVGYGHDKELNKDYWIVRNSWSTLWGEDGYVRLDRPAVEPCCTDENVCPPKYGKVCGTAGCLSDPAYPIVKKNKPVKF